MEEFDEILEEIGLKNEDGAYMLRDSFLHAARLKLLDEGITWESIVWVSLNRN